MVSGEMTCVKNSLFFFNLLFVISGIAIITVGAIIQAQSASYNGVMDISSPAIILIVVGVVVFVVAFFGCCGACKKNHCMVITFAVFLLIIFTLELAAGIAAYVKRNDVENYLEKQMNNSLADYPDHKKIEKTWDAIQHDFQCCGIRNFSDWRPVFKNDSLPYTCCKDISETESCTVGSQERFTEGCLPSFRAKMEKYCYIIGGVGIGIAIIQLLGVILACTLARAIRKEYETV